MTLPAGWWRLERPCSKCHRGVLWALTHNGKRMPLDPAVDESGNTAVRRDATGTLCARVLTAEHPRPAAGEVLMVPHFATCAYRAHDPGPLPHNVIPLRRDRTRG